MPFQTAKCCVLKFFFDEEAACHFSTCLHWSQCAQENVSSDHYVSQKDQIFVFFCFFFRFRVIIRGNHLVPNLQHPVAISLVLNSVFNECSWIVFFRMRARIYNDTPLLPNYVHIIGILSDCRSGTIQKKAKH